MGLRRGLLTAIVTTALGATLLAAETTAGAAAGGLAEQWLIRAPAKQAGAAIAIPFYSRENG